MLTPPPDAAFGVISDIDDTVLVSHATSTLKAVLTAILNNAQTRSPFPGVPAFYRALQAGPGGDGYNPVFYVSSSPWNFYDLLTEFMAIHAMPAGPLFLRDYGLQSLRRTRAPDAQTGVHRATADHLSGIAVCPAG